MADAFPLQRILERLCESEGKVPPCPACGRRVLFRFEESPNGDKPRVAIWMWCSACPEAAAVFNVSPVPPWVKGK